MSASAVFFLATSSNCSYNLLAFDVVDLAHRAGHFAQVPQEDAPPLAFLLHALPAADVHAQLAADGLQRQPDLLLNLRVAGDRFLDSLVNGTHTLAMWTISVTGPLGSPPRDWLRP